MGYVNALGHYVPSRGETYQYRNALGHIITSTPESRGETRINNDKVLYDWCDD